LHDQGGVGAVLSWEREGDVVDFIGGEPAAGFMTSESFPRDGGVLERCESTIMRSSVGEGTLDAGDNVAMGGRAIGADGLACDPIGRG